jgi:hypothetical protein
MDQVAIVAPPVRPLAPLFARSRNRTAAAMSRTPTHRDAIDRAIGVHLLVGTV